MILFIKRIPKTLLQLTGAKFFLFPFAIAFLISFSSCDKSSPIGLDVQPANDLLNVGFDDTTKLITKTVRETHLRTDQGLNTTGFGLIGKYIDPVFGETEASLYTQLRQPTGIVYNSFGTNPVCDSVVLSLAYAKTWYGEAVSRRPIKNQKINVYEVLEDISSAVSYYSDTLRPNYSTRDLVQSNHLFNPDIASNVYINGVNQGPELRLPLDNMFGQTLLNNQTTGNIASDATFRNFFKGLYITATNTTGLAPGEGRILSYDLQSSSSKVEIYFHNDTSQHQANMKYAFNLSSANHFSHFDRDTVNRDLEIKRQVADTTKTNNYERVFVQSMAGLKTKITMPNLLERVKSGQVSINQAELIVKVDVSKTTYNQDSFSPPQLLYLFGIADDGSSYLISDLFEQSGTPGYYNGFYDGSIHEYHLKLSRYIQQVLDKKINNNGLYLVVPHAGSYGAVVNANRVVIGGGDNTSGTNNLQMKLNITYTKLH